MGHQSDQEGTAAADTEARNLDTRLRHQDFRKAIFVAGDLIEHAPAGEFPFKEAILELLIAAENLESEAITTRLGKLYSAIKIIRPVLEALEEEEQRLDPDLDTAGRRTVARRAPKLYPESGGREGSGS